MMDSNLIQVTDYLLSKLNFGKTFIIKIPFREEWAADSLLKDCLQSLILISYHQVDLILVTGLQNIRSNKKANEYVVGGSFLDEIIACNDILTPLVVWLNYKQIVCN